MNQVRSWLAAAFIWPWIVAAVDQIWLPLELTAFVYPAVVLVSLPVLLTCVIERVSTAWLALALLPLAALVKVWFWGLGTDHAFAATLVELLAIGVALFILCELARNVGAVDRTVRDFAIPELAEHPPAFEADQPRLYQEIRRARRYRRQLSLMALSVEPGSLQADAVTDSLLLELQRSNIQRYANAQVGNMLRDEANGCQIVTQRNGHFIVLLPETDSVGMEALARRLSDRARERLGVRLRVGSASFPDDEVTLSRLVTSAEASMENTVGVPPDAKQVPAHPISDASSMGRQA